MDSDVLGNETYKGELMDFNKDSKARKIIFDINSSDYNNDGQYFFEYKSGNLLLKYKMQVFNGGENSEQIKIYTLLPLMAPVLVRNMYHIRDLCDRFDMAAATAGLESEHPISKLIGHIRLMADSSIDGCIDGPKEATKKLQQLLK